MFLRLVWISLCSFYFFLLLNTYTLFLFLNLIIIEKKNVTVEGCGTETQIF